METVILFLVLMLICAMFFNVSFITYIIYKRENTKEDRPVIIQNQKLQHSIEETQKILDEAYEDKGFEEFINSLDAYLTDQPEEENK